MALKEDVKRDGPVVFDDDLDVFAMDGLEPGGKRVDVGDCRGESEEIHVFRQKDQGFFPDGAALRIIDIMDLVVDDPGVFFERWGVVEDPVAEYLCCHDKDGRVRVDGDVAGHDADSVAIEPAEVPEFLVGEGLDGRRINDARLPLDAGGDDVFGNGCLSGACRRRNDDRAPFVDGIDSFLLEPIVNHRVIIDNIAIKSKGMRRSLRHRCLPHDTSRF